MTDFSQVTYAGLLYLFSQFKPSATSLLVYKAFASTLASLVVVIELF